VKGLLPGFDPPAVDWPSVVSAFVRAARRSPLDFNRYRRAHGLGNVPPWVGVLVSHTARRGGLFPVGHVRAVLRQSRGHLLTIWGKGTP
jgi:hypothetical protein